jgi:carbon storage regulator
MLVLSRKKGESLVIGHSITVMLVEIRGDKVRLGVEAPWNVPVHREEVEAKIAEVSNRVHAGESLTDIEADLDARENQEANHG